MAVGSLQNNGSLGKLRVLMQMRPNALSQRGGDTVVMERISEGLRSFGHEVVLDLEDKIDPRAFDLVHLYNFATPEVTEKQAKRAVEANVPFVVTTMYEDWPFFFSPMVETFLPLEKYVHDGQKPNSWNELWSNRERIPPAERQDNSYTAFHAEALIGTGNTETAALKRDYPHSKLITDYRCGCEVKNDKADPTLFRNFSGLTNFVLCVGRLEWRKNQLMVLKALEESELPVIFATGGFTYQADYEALCRAFKRKGRTIFLPKIEADLLASAFAASTVHVLPSFFELPGLVNIEAAKYGTNVVVSDYGTIRDYLGDDAIYCQPDSPESILAAINEGWNRPHSDKLQKRVEQYTWKAATERYLEIYSQVLGRLGNQREARSMKQSDHGDLNKLDVALQTIAKASAEVTRARETVSLIPTRVGEDENSTAGNDQALKLCDEGDKFTREGKLAEAANRYKLATQVSPSMARPFRGLGVVSLNQGEFADSEGYFRRALLVDAGDIRSELGIAAVQAQTGRKKESSLRLQGVLLKEPANLIGLRQYLQLAYELAEYSQLEKVLRNYLDVDGLNADIRFCLAGCLFKQARNAEALSVINQILNAHPNHAASQELKVILEKEVAAPVTNTKPIGQSLSPQQLSIKTVTEPVNINDQESENPYQTAMRHPSMRELEELLRARKFNETLALADKLLEAAAEESDQKVLVSIIKAESLICLGEGGRAREILELNRDHIVYGYRATSSLGVYWGSQNEWEKASLLFRVAIALKPDHDVSLSGQGIVYLLRGDKEEAWEYFSRAHAANPENIRALTGMIEVAYPLNRLSALEQALQKYLEYVPANLSILYAHAGCAYALGNKELAIEQLNKIKIFDNNHALANELLAKIDEDLSQAVQNRA